MSLTWIRHGRKPGHAAETNLATLFDPARSLKPAWIGLYSQPGKDDRVRHWCRSGVKYDKGNWANNEPNEEEGSAASPESASSLTPGGFQMGPIPLTETGNRRFMKN